TEVSPEQVGRPGRRTADQARRARRRRWRGALTLPRRRPYVTEPVLILLAQASPPAPGADDPGVKTIFGLVLQGGLVMLPIAVCSIVALAIVVERLTVTRRSRVMPRGFLASLPDRIEDRDEAA